MCDQGRRDGGNSQGRLLRGGGIWAEPSTSQHLLPKSISLDVSRTMFFRQDEC